MAVLKVLCALDTSDLDEAVGVVRKLGGLIGGFKVGHSLTLRHGLSVVDRLRDEGANRIFLDLKFHDIPNTVALAVREASKYGVWMMTLHTSGGPAMMTAAVEEARAYGDAMAPLLVGVSVLTSLDQNILQNHLGVSRSVEDQMSFLSDEAMTCGLDGVVCPAPHIRTVRQKIGHEGVIVTPGIRMPSGEKHDQSMIGSPEQALQDGANYLVIGRALTECDNPEERLNQLMSSSKG